MLTLRCQLSRVWGREQLHRPVHFLQFASVEDLATEGHDRVSVPGADVCLAGTYTFTNETSNETSNATRCVECAADTFQPESANSSYAQCPDGYCLPCVPGSYGTSPTTCAACPEGFFSNETSSATCQVCPDASSASQGSTTCTAYPAVWRTLLTPVHSRPVH